MANEMVTFDELIQPQREVPLHPRLRDWKKRLSQPGIVAKIELYRPSTALGLSQTEMVLHFWKEGQPQPDEIVALDDDLNAGLVALRVPSITLDQEAQRFALALRAALRKAEREFGDGYLNAVLGDFIRDSGLTRYPEIAEIIEHSTALAFDREGKTTRSYSLCREVIANAIGASAHELRNYLDYNDDEVKTIMTRALEQYLDERFSVSSRRRLGLL